MLIQVNWKKAISAIEILRIKYSVKLIIWFLTTFDTSYPLFLSKS